MKRLMAAAALIIVLAGCGAFRSAPAAKTQQVFIAAVWNVQALFDGQEDGDEYAEYREASGWTAEKYAARITAISQAVLQMGKEEDTPLPKAGLPGLVGFAEIENAGVLDELAKGILAKHGYCWTAFAKLPGAPLGIGFLSRFPLLDIKAHSVTVGKETAPRPILEVRIEPGGKPLVFLLCHWKSKLGNGTEGLRRSSAGLIQRRLGEIKETEAETPVIVMGDLNENHDEFYRGADSVLCALLPDEPGAASLAAGAKTPSDFLVLSAEKPPRALSFPEDIYALYSPWLEDMTEGSYYYKGGWETIDHFLLSDALFGGSFWGYAGCQVLSHAPFTASGGIPDAYIPRTGRGLSDHLPLLLYLTGTR